jgi:putative nucleotidyltransferase with HDIG domain
VRIPFLKKKPNGIIRSLDENSSTAVDESLRGHNFIFRIGLAAVLILGITFLYPLDKIYQPIEIPQIGEIASRDIVAPFDFQILKNKSELKSDRERVLANLKPVTVYDTLIANNISNKLDQFFNKVDSIAALNFDSIEFKTALWAEFPQLPESVSVMLMDGPNVLKLRRYSRDVVDTILTAGLIEDLENLPLKESGLVTLKYNDEIRTVPRDRLFDVMKAKSYISMKAGGFLLEHPGLEISAVYIANLFLEPVLTFDQESTTRNKEAELEGISKYKGLVYADEKIIKANERFTELHHDKLISLARFKRQQEGKDKFIDIVLPPMGRLLFVAFPILFFGFFLYFFRKNIFAQNSALILFGILMAGIVIISNVVVSQHFLSPYLVPIAIASMLVTIAFDLETGLFITFAISILMGILSGFKLDVVFVGVVAGTVATFSVRRVRHRHEFYKSIIYLSLVYFVAVYIIESLKLTPSADLWRHTGLAVLNGFLSPVLTIGLLPLFESTFSLTTDITLLELSDLNRPLLKRLAIEAPGTYNHSIMIGTLAEEAAKAIGANSLLARVGSYYHDIGKMLKPEYFVENQMGAKNKHEKLAPSMSALILEAHVKEGKELAEDNGLPECIMEFITGHHGTSVMTFFYDKALKSGEDIDIDDFRYPGPRPLSKEVAIVMLADSIEAASRSLEDPTPARIRGLVRKIFSSRFESGDLDESNLTLKDLHNIEESFIRVLIGVFHRRIAYPDKEPQETT